MHRFFWKGISNEERHKVIDEITNIIDRYGVILNFQRFSDVSISYLVEIEEIKVSPLYQKLSEILSMEGLENSPGDSQKTDILFLNITFTQGTGDLVIEVPDIPE